MVAKEAYRQYDFATAVEWFRAALEANTTVDEEEEQEIYDYLAFSEFKIGNIDRALQISRRLLERQPGNARIFDNIAYYERAEREAQPSSQVLPLSQLRNFSHDNLLRHAEPDMDRFRLLCQGRVLYKPPAPLTCQFRDYGNPVLLLKPARVEMLTLGHENLRVRLAVSLLALSVSHASSMMHLCSFSRSF